MTCNAIVAYNYDEQRWIDGEPARVLRAAQLREEIALFQGPTGEEYADFLGVNRFTAIDLLEDSLRKVES